MSPFWMSFFRLSGSPAPLSATALDMESLSRVAWELALESMPLRTLELSTLKITRLFAILVALTCPVVAFLWDQWHPWLGLAFGSFLVMAVTHVLQVRLFHRMGRLHRLIMTSLFNRDYSVSESREPGRMSLKLHSGESITVSDRHHQHLLALLKSAPPSVSTEPVA